MKPLQGRDSARLINMRTRKKQKNTQTMKPNDFTKNESVDSMKAAASRLGLTRELVKQLKDNGCPAFKGGRVYLRKLARNPQ